MDDKDQHPLQDNILRIGSDSSMDDKDLRMHTKAEREAMSSDSSMDDKDF